MPTFRRPYKTNKLHRGMTSAADFLVEEGYSRLALNMRHSKEIGTERRNGTEWRADLVGLDNSKHLTRCAIDNALVTVQATGGGGACEIKAFDADGAAATIQLTGTLAFDTGSAEIKPNTVITGGTSGATAIVLRVNVTSGDWGGTAAGTLVIRKTNATPFQAEAITGAPSGAANALGAETLINYNYLGTDASKIRLHAVEDTVFVINIDQEIATDDAPGTLASVKGNKTDFSVLQGLYSAVVGDIWKTLASSQGYPAGYYQCVTIGDAPTTTAPIWKRIPKPEQVDALYDPTTMPHRLIRASDSPLVFYWEQPPYVPRYSGGDVDGYDDVTNEPIIRNPPELKGRKIRAFAQWAMSRFLFVLDNKKIVTSRQGFYFDYWQSDILNPQLRDPIVYSLIAPNSGDVLYAASTGNAVFIQLERRQVIFTTSDGGVLSGGGEQTPSNAFADVCGQFDASPDVPPAVWTDYVFMLTANKEIAVFTEIEGQNQPSYVLAPDPLNQPIFADFAQTTPVWMEAIGRTLFVFTEDDGYAWVFDVYAVGRSDELVGAWGQLQLDERLDFVYGDGDTLVLVTEFDATFSMLGHFPTERIVEPGFAHYPRLDRRETIAATSYNAAEDTTLFTLKTNATLARTNLILRYDLFTLRVDNGGTGTIAPGALIDGATSGAQGTVLRVTLIAGTWAGGDAVAILQCRRTVGNSARFTEGEDIEIATVKFAEAQYDEERTATIGDSLRPIRIGFTFNNGGPVEILVGDVITDQTSGATARVERVSLTSGTWAGGTAAGSLEVVPLDALEFANGNVIEPGSATLTTHPRRAIFKGDYAVAQHYIGRNFTSRHTRPRQWPLGTSGAVVVLPTMTVFYDRTTDFDVRIAEDGRADYVQRFAAKIIGVVAHDDPAVETGSEEFLIGCEAATCDISIESATSGNFRIPAIELVAEVSEV